jgi:F-box domain
VQIFHPGLSFTKPSKASLPTSTMDRLPQALAAAAAAQLSDLLPPQDSHALYRLLVNPKAEQRKRLKDTRPCPLYLWVALSTPNDTPLGYGAEMDKMLRDMLGSHYTEKRATSAMCAHDFFFAKCQPCSLPHFAPADKTLHKIVGPRELVHLQRCHRVFNKRKTMTAMKFVELDINKAKSMTCEDYVNAELEKLEIDVGDIAFAVLGNELYLSEADGMTVLTLSDTCTDKPVKKPALCRDPRFADLSRSLLESILMFLSENDYLNLCLTCKSWNNELAGGSDSFWNFVMQGRKWENVYNLGRPARQVFLEHLQVERRIDSMRGAFGELLDVETTINVACQFKKHVKRADYFGACTEVMVWSKNHVLGVYARDCRLRLLEVYWDSRTNKQALREQAHWTIRLIKGYMEDELVLCQVALGTNYIGCWCNTIEPDQTLISQWIVMVHRDEFVHCNSINAVTQNRMTNYFPKPISIDIGKTVLKYIQGRDEYSKINKRLANYRKAGTPYGKVLAMMQGNMCACGDASFMGVVGISIPVNPATVGGASELQRIANIVVVFSATTKSIVWTCDAAPIVADGLDEDPRFWMRSKPEWNGSDKMLIVLDCNKGRPVMIGEVGGKTFEEEPNYKMTVCEMAGPSGYNVTEHWFRPIVILDKYIATAESHKMVNKNDEEDEDDDADDDDDASDDDEEEAEDYRRGDKECAVCMYEYSSEEKKLIVKSTFCFEVDSVFQLFKLSGSHAAVMAGVPYKKLSPYSLNIFDGPMFELCVLHGETGKVFMKRIVGDSFGNVDNVPFMCYDQDTMGMAWTNSGIALVGQDFEK